MQADEPVPGEVHEELEELMQNEDREETEISDEDSLMNGVEKEDLQNVTAGSDPILCKKYNKIINTHSPCVRPPFRQVLIQEWRFCAFKSHISV